LQIIIILDLDRRAGVFSEAQLACDAMKPKTHFADELERLLLGMGLE
jgi:hypothetical protein